MLLHGLSVVMQPDQKGTESELTIIYLTYNGLLIFIYYVRFIILIYRPPIIIFKQQPTSSSLGLGKASPEEGGQYIQNIMNSSNVSHIPGGHAVRQSQSTSISLNSQNSQANNIQQFTKGVPSKTFDTQSLNLGNVCFF